MEYVKYPRTYHLPFSPGATSDDKVLDSINHFLGNEVVVTEKMDGENTTIYRDYCHARSINSGSHESRDWIKKFQSEIGYNIPDGWRICGENLFAKHSIYYSNLDSYFYAFGIWNDNNECLHWDDTAEYAALLGICVVPVLYRGIFKESVIKEVFDNLDKEKQEGIVVRLARLFHFNDFEMSIAKAVRKGHVTTDKHWKSRKL